MQTFLLLFADFYFSSTQPSFWLRSSLFRILFFFFLLLFLAQIIIIRSRILYLSTEWPHVPHTLLLLPTSSHCNSCVFFFCHFPFSLSLSFTIFRNITVEFFSFSNKSLFHTVFFLVFHSVSNLNFYGFFSWFYIEMTYSVFCFFVQVYDF